METEIRTKSPILEVAWTRYAHLNAASLERSKSHLRLRRWIAIMAVLATLLAILIEIYPPTFPSILMLVLKVLLVATPIIGSILAAIVGKFYTSGDWLIFRAGAEEILKEMYTFRTILKNSPERRAWLEKRITSIQRQIYRGLGGELVLKQYSGPIPPKHDPADPTSDPGFDDLNGDQYFTYRVEGQLAWHMSRINRYQKERTRLQYWIYIAGGAGALLAAMGVGIENAGSFNLWVALTSSLVAAMSGWQELRNLDSVIKNYSKVMVELMAIYDHWTNLEPEERTQTEFHKMVQGTENLLWSENVEYIKSMQEALSEAGTEEAELVTKVVNASREADARFRKSVRESLTAYGVEAVEKTEKALTESVKNVIGSLAEDAASEIVQQELEAMGQAAVETVQAVVRRSAGLRETIQQVAEEFSGVEIDKETPAGVLHSMISRYPTTGDLKG